jgi:hypothetical protein
MVSASRVLHIATKRHLTGSHTKAKCAPPVYIIIRKSPVAAQEFHIVLHALAKLTSARIEAGNISIGMIRKRARGIRDTEYFKLKIRQSSLPDKDSMFYVAA